MADLATKNAIEALVIDSGLSKVTIYNHQGTTFKESESMHLATVYEVNGEKANLAGNKSVIGNESDRFDGFRTDGEIYAVTGGSNKEIKS